MPFIPITNSTRPAVAMIELIFAIVIIGIVLMSVPNLMQTSAKSGYLAIQQESINEAATHLNMILGYHWDQNDTDERYLDPILHVSASANSDLAEDGNTTRRKGTPPQSYRRFVREDGVELNATSAANLGMEASDNNISNDVDDFNDRNHSVTLIEGTGDSADYIEKSDTLIIHTSVQYLSDDLTPNTESYINPTGNNITFDWDGTSTVNYSSNIKLVTVSLSSTLNNVDEDLKKNIVLRAFSCNIGASKLKEKAFQP